MRRRGVCRKGGGCRSRPRPAPGHGHGRLGSPCCRLTVRARPGARPLRWWRRPWIRRESRRCCRARGSRVRACRSLSRRTPRPKRAGPPPGAWRSPAKDARAVARRPYRGGCLRPSGGVPRWSRPAVADSPAIPRRGPDPGTRSGARPHRPPSRPPQYFQGSRPGPQSLGSSWGASPSMKRFSRFLRPGFTIGVR